MRKSKVVLITSTLLGILSLAGCSPGWSIFGWDTIETQYEYLEVMDSDSTLHFYAESFKLNKDIWCHTHNQYEIVRKK